MNNYTFNIQGVKLEDWIAKLPDGAQLRVVNTGAVSIYCKDTNEFFFVKDDKKTVEEEKGRD